MSFDFCHDGQCYHLETTKDGEVHCEPISQEPQPVAMEPSEEEQ